MLVTGIPGVVERNGNKVEGHRINIEQKLDKSTRSQAFEGKHHFPLHVSYITQLIHATKIEPKS